MTRFTVVWHRLAQDDLARIWLSSNFRAAVTAASDQVDAELRIGPETKGKLVTKHLRQLLVGPPVVVFEVSEDDRIVRVWGVKLRS